MSHPYIKWYDRSSRGHRRYLIDKLFLGRTCRGVVEEKRIQINHPTISRDHAVIQISRFGIEITDLSTNGTWVNGVRMAPGASRQLIDGDSIELGETTFCVVCPDPIPTQPVEERGDQTQVRPSTVWVTNLVADVRGFSAMCQSCDSNVTYKLMKTVFRRFSDVIVNFRGTVKDYAGDAVFAFWEHSRENAPDQATAACRAALFQNGQIGDIRHQMSTDHPTFNQLRMGWGITSGPVTISNYGTRPSSLAVVGDCVNLAFRLSAIANKEIDSSIVLDRKTASLVNEKLRIQDLGQIPTKGRSGLEQIYGMVGE
jgi:adenylate cyclase